MTASLARRAAAEFLGTLFLVATVVGSGIMGERLAGGNVAIALLANTIATGAALVALILAFGPISGAHLNPVVTIADAMEGGIAWREVPRYVLAQVFGGICGTIAAHLMFGLHVVSLSRHDAQRSCSIVQRIRRHVRFASGDLGMRAAPFERGGLCGRRLHHRRILVHGFDVLCKPRRNHCARAQRHVRRDTPGGRSRIHRRAIRRRNRRDAGIPLARPILAIECQRRDVAARSSSRSALKPSGGNYLRTTDSRSLDQCERCSSDSVWV